MDGPIQWIRQLVEVFFFHPKSTITSVVGLILILIIAFYVNRRRDASGRVSFLDRGRTGFIGVQILEVGDEGSPRRGWLLPLWAGERRLLLTVRLMMPAGRYEARSAWRADGPLPGSGDIFTPAPLDKERASPLSEAIRFTLARPRSVTYRLSAVGKTLQVDTPDVKSLGTEGEAPPFPLPVRDSSLRKLAARFDKLQAGEAWSLTLMDDKIVAGMKQQARAATRKAEGLEVKCRDLSANLDKALQKLKAAKKG